MQDITHDDITKLNKNKVTITTKFGKNEDFNKKNRSIFVWKQPDCNVRSFLSLSLPFSFKKKKSNFKHLIPIGMPYSDIQEKAILSREKTVCIKMGKKSAYINKKRPILKWQQSSLEYMSNGPSGLPFVFTKQLKKKHCKSSNLVPIDTSNGNLQDHKIVQVDDETTLAFANMIW